ncbi:AAA family ATPase [Rhodococcus kroppenstedtii]|uniref:AAA family ATPase n=1 Tax=Rhodococcoides kroppenstedtii TaxID=293050 RepID=UPI002953D385|nr:AAA family ATPase [Rhodococcus kroppenstedtii]MDV7197409.1 AAA family ATPase [Rhodococcus kroppenstedtii]
MNGPEMLRIASIKIDGVFGIPGELEISFLPVRSNNPVSAIIFGENGSGKSSVSKAIEWATQNRVNRSSVSKHAPRSTLLNVSRQDASFGSATARLSDGSELQRRVTWDADENALHIEGSDPHPAFSRSPLVLTRADVLSFIKNKPSARGQFFLDYALNAAEDESTTRASSTADIRRDQEMEILKQKIRDHAVPISEHLGLPHAEDLDQIAAMLDELYKGFAPGLRHQISIPRRLEPTVTVLQEYLKQYADAKKARLKAEKRATAHAPKRITQLKATLVDIDDWLTVAFSEITGSHHIERIRVELGTPSATALNFQISTVNGATFDEQVLSEGHQDLLAMLFFLAVSRVTSAHGQLRVLVLDDLVQSIDANIRVALTQFILREFKKWQIIATVHDRLWREQMQRLFHDAGVPLVAIELHGWTFDTGSRVTQPLRNPSAPLEMVMSTRDPAAVSALAGRLLEQICDVLSWTIPIRVQRRYRDRYTLEDLWPGVESALRNSSINSLIQRTGGSRHLRNLVGAHHNEWARTVTAGEADQFASAVLELFRCSWCDTCAGWVQSAGQGFLRCSCGAIEITNVKVGR